MLSPQELRLQDVSTTIEACLQTTMTVDEAARFLLDRGYSGAPVTNPAGHLVSIVSTGDLLRFILASSTEDRAQSLEATGQTWRKVLTAAKDTRVGDACKTIVRSRDHRLVLVEEERPVGIFTVADLARIIAALDDAPQG